MDASCIEHATFSPWNVVHTMSVCPRVDACPGHYGTVLYIQLPRNNSSLKTHRLGYMKVDTRIERNHWCILKLQIPYWCICPHTICIFAVCTHQFTLPPSHLSLPPSLPLFLSPPSPSLPPSHWIKIKISLCHAYQLTRAFLHLFIRG